MTFWSSLKDIFKNYFIAGILVLTPIAVTVWILKTIIVWADGFFVSILPKGLQPSFLNEHRIPGLGLMITVSIVLLLGVLTRVYLGKRLLMLGDKIIARIPLGRGIYNGIKEMLATFVAPKEDRFRRVVLVEYPKENSWAIGFVTGDCDDDLSPSGGQRFIRVFVPTAPNPTSGFFLIVPEDETKRLNMSVESAMKLILSGGIVKPRQNLSEGS